MARRPSWVCDTVIALERRVSDSEMSQRLDEVVKVLIDCLRQLQSSKSHPHENPVADLFGDHSQEGTGTDG